MACVILQWVSTMSAAAALVFAYVSFEAQYRDIMTELASGHAVLNVSLPVLLLHPILVAQLFVMVGQVYAMLMGLAVAGFKIDASAWLDRYTAAVLVPYLVLALGYFLVTLSFVWGCELGGGSFTSGFGRPLYPLTSPPPLPPAPLDVFFLPLFLFGAFFAGMLFWLVTGCLMPYLKTSKQDDSEAQEEYEKELKEASRISYVCRWAVGSLAGLPRAVRGQLREVLWWADVDDDGGDGKNLWPVSFIAVIAFSPISWLGFLVLPVFVANGDIGRGMNDVMKVRTQP